MVRVWALLLIRVCLISKILQLLEDQKQELCPQILISVVKEVQQFKTEKVTMEEWQL